MAFIGGALVRVSPSFVMPGVLMHYNQQSGAFETLAGGDPMVRLGAVDQAAYVRTLDVRTMVASGDMAYNQLPSATITGAQKQTKVYLVRTRGEYDHHDVAAAAEGFGVALPEATRLAGRMGIFQQARNALLYGFNPANGEGLLATQGATTVTLPADSLGHTTVVTYDNGQMGIFLLTQVSATKARMMQGGSPARIVILGPQRALLQFQYQGIISLGSYQLPGGGSAATAGLVENVAKQAGDEVDWVYDDTLIGKGTGGTDMIIMVVPELQRRNRPGSTFNTNEFAELMPGLDANTLQLTDMAAPREIPTPLAGGAIDVLMEQRITSGWALRPEGITLISMPYQ